MEGWKIRNQVLKQEENGKTKKHDGQLERHIHLKDSKCNAAPAQPAVASSPVLCAALDATI